VTQITSALSGVLCQIFHLVERLPSVSPTDGTTASKSSHKFKISEIPNISILILGHEILFSMSYLQGTEGTLGFHSCYRRFLNYLGTEDY
jgi:hypothetical protein